MLLVSDTLVGAEMKAEPDGRIEAAPATRSLSASADTLTLLHVSMDRSRSAATAFLDDHAMPGQHAFAGISELGGAFGARFARLPGQEISHRALPSLTLVGPGGEVVATLAATADTGLLEMLKRHLS